MAAATLWLAGCASTPNVAVVEPVGPAPVRAALATGDGSLVVYSARIPAVTDLNRDQWLSNIDPEQTYLGYQPEHTSYTIYTKTGQWVATVPNESGEDGASPAIVPLAPGAYRVEAQALDCDGSRINVVVPVLIKPGATTVAHLGGDWRPQGVAENDVARLPCGRPIGWRAPADEFASLARP